MKIAQSILLMATMIGYVLSGTSCSSEDETSLFGKKEIPLELDVNVSQSRSIITGTNLPECYFGIFATFGNGNEVIENGVNTRVDYNGTTCTLNQKIYLQDGADIPIYAYYPYNKSYSDILYLTGLIPIETNSQTDYLYGYSADSDNKLTYAKASNPKVSILFKHAMSRITFKIKKAEDNAKDYSLSSIGVSGVYTNATMNIKGDSEGKHINAPSGEGNITINPYNMDVDKTYKEVDLLAIPMDMTNKEVKFKLVFKDLSEAIVAIPKTTWLSGQQYTYNVIINDSWLSISKAEITSWNNTNQGSLDVDDGNYVGASIGDIYYSDGTYSSASDLNPLKTPIGIVFALTDEKDGDINRTLRHSEHGRIIALHNVNDNGCPWATNYSDVSALTNYTVGENPPVKINSSGMIIQWEVPGTASWADFNGKENTQKISAESYPAAFACYNYQTKERPAGSWYLPAAGELKLLELLYNDKIIYNRTTDWFTQADNNYWSSTEIGEESATAWWGNESMMSWNKKQTLPVRAASTF